MNRRLALLGVYLIFTPLFILSLIFYQFYLYHQDSAAYGKVLGLNTSNVEYKAIPNVIDQNSHSYLSSEARIDVLREFFARYKSPLEDHADDIVAAADKYDLDYRLIPAIAMQESTLCLKKPKDSFNCWGFGIYGGRVLRFESYPQAIETVSKALRENYYDIGLIEPHDIMTKYTPSSDGSWADAVSFVMGRIEESL